MISFILVRGGLTENVREVYLFDDLRTWGISFAEVPESTVTAEVLRKNRLVFIESPLAHDDVVAAKDQPRTFLETGVLGRR